MRRYISLLWLIVFLIAYIPSSDAKAAGIQFCYVKHHSLAKQGGPDYPLNAMFELIKVYPRSTGPSEGQSAWVLLNEQDLAFVKSLNTQGFMKWAVKDAHGSLYMHTSQGTQWFPIILSGNIIEITEIRNGRGRVAGLAAGPLDPNEINRDNTPYFVSWVPVIWKSGRITNPPKGYGVMPIFNPDQYTSHAISEIWVNLSDLICPIDLSQSYKTSVAGWVTLGLRVHWEPTLTSAVATKLFPGTRIWIWQTISIDQLTWGLTDWGWIVLAMNGRIYTQ